MDRELNLVNELHNFVPLKIIAWSSTGFVLFQDIDGKTAHVLSVTSKDQQEGCANIVLWLLQKAYDDICATEEDPRNDTRVKVGGDGWIVKGQIKTAIKLYKQNFRVEAVEKAWTQPKGDE